jgi:hypothetical protein
MALNTRQKLEQDLNLENEYTVLKNERGLRAADAATVDATSFTPHPKTGSIRIPSGYFWERLATGRCRVLPISKVVDNAGAGVITTSPTFKVHSATIFKVGQTIQNQANNAVVGTIQSIDVEANTITLAANAASAIAVGGFIHLAGTTIAKPTTPTGVGVVGCNVSNLEITEFDDVALHVGATVYAVRMPQPAAVAALFPLIHSS